MKLEELDERDGLFAIFDEEAWNTLFKGCYVTTPRAAKVVRVDTPEAERQAVTHAASKVRRRTTVRRKKGR